jgi:alpha-glucosidase
LYFPDLLNRNVSSYWQAQLAVFLETVPFDDVWLDMNEQRMLTYADV